MEKKQQITIVTVQPLVDLAFGYAGKRNHKQGNLEKPRCSVLSEESRTGLGPWGQRGCWEGSCGEPLGVTIRSLVLQGRPLRILAHLAAASKNEPIAGELSPMYEPSSRSGTLGSEVGSPRRFCHGGDRAQLQEWAGLTRRHGQRSEGRSHQSVSLFTGTRLHHYSSTPCFPRTLLIANLVYQGNWCVKVSALNNDHNYFRQRQKSSSL